MLVEVQQSHENVSTAVLTAIIGAKPDSNGLIAD